jgi:copper chaperone CopZ
MERLTMAIGGMSCGHCVAAVRRALEALPGIEIEQVAVGSAAVRYDPAVTSPAEIARAVEAAGYAPRSTA